MCGIVGIAAIAPIGDRQWLARGRDSMVHRGPDDAGEWWAGNGCVGLAHRRLSIIDLSPAGHQPMRDATGALTLVFNGEIYNYRDLRSALQSKGHQFRTHSDTEVILAAYREWGTECLVRLNGMFAFALHDSARRQLLLARDRAGEKPLFYMPAQGELRFASELKGLLADPTVARRINPEALDCYLALGYSPGEQCILSGAKKLPPAHGLLFDLATGVSRVWRYWHPPEAPADGEPCGSELVDELELLLEDSVRRQLVADVPVGVLLSGGVDSSLVVAMAVRASQKVKTFTVGFPGFARYDESEHASLIARHFGTEHIELHAGHVGPDLMPKLARQYDEPVADSSMIPTFLVSQLVRAHCTVALGGDGGDELFGGYQQYSRLLSLQAAARRIPLALRRPVARMLGARLPTGFRGRNSLQSLGHDLSLEVPPIAAFFDPAERGKLLGSAVPNRGPFAEALMASRAPSSVDLLQQATRMDFENYMPEDILVKVDRASMLNSLELRAPFLDFRIIDFAFGRVPSSLKAGGTQRKILLKRLAQRVLPPEFDRHRKQGFGIPLHHWLRAGPWRDFSRDVLVSRESLFDQASVARLLRGQDRGMGNAERIFALTLFELWRREFRFAL